MGFFKNFIKFSLFAAVFPTLAIGAQTTTRVPATRSVVANPDSVTSASIRRAATSVIARNAANNGRRTRTVVSARPNSTNSRTASNRAMVTRVPVDKVETTNVSRAATTKVANTARSAKSATVARSGTKNSANVSRAGKGRATAVFNDVSKIGGGYAACRDSYATCMDQFCANTNDTYRRCFCSDRFMNYRQTSESLDQALNMLADFQNKNLDAVDKTAAEVNAMYTATEGEAAIKKDTSASQKLLNNISDVLSGKRTYQSSSSSSSSVGLLDVSKLFSFTDSDDIFSGGATFESLSSLGTSGYTNMSEMEGVDLYNAANRQCTAIAKEQCGDVTFNLARSAYSVMITQDCNIYEKSLNAKKESVQETLRTAEKYLREARLEEYREHNSADVNECLTRVDNAIRQPFVCGPNYELCMDNTGMYINATTGEPIYSKALFGLNNLIVLDGSSDVLGANAEFNTWLDTKKKFVTAALDSCRNIADEVWTEYKRIALIKIAQAQDEKIQSVKDSCVETIAECYDDQTGQLNTLGGEQITKRTSAISAMAARGMCKDKVLACAALYGDVDGCVYDDATKTIVQNTGTTGKCGLDSLLAYVNTVDSVRVANGCEDALRGYVDELCADDGAGYPWGCRNLSKAEIDTELKKQVKSFCGIDLLDSDENGEPTGQLNDSIINVNNIRKRLLNEIQDTMNTLMADKCAYYGGYWFGGGTNVYNDRASTSSSRMKGFYADVYNNKEVINWGVCVEDTLKVRCIAQNDNGNDYTTYNETTGVCSFKPAWYRDKCQWIGGYYSNSMCYVSKSEFDAGYKEFIIKGFEPREEGTAQ